MVTLQQQQQQQQQQLQQQANLLAHHFPSVFGDETRRPVASQTLVHLTLVALEPSGTDALHIATAGQCACLGVHAVVVADVCWKSARKHTHTHTHRYINTHTSPH